MSKQYGLSFPKQTKGHQLGQVSHVKPSIFDDDSDDDDKPARPTGIRTVKRQDIISQQKALADDPTVYQYDEVYDEIEKKKAESKLARKDIDKKPKYINRLLAAADKRKKENERRIERQVQKEREEEGDMFKDKESFVTPSYKKKLEEMRELEEQEKREEYLESIGDVRKQGNLDGFYRHLYEQKVNYDANDKETKKIKEEKIDDEDKVNVTEDKVTVTEDKVVKPKKREYRKKRESDDESDKETEVKKEHLPSNIDADSDFSVDSSDSEDESTKADIKEKSPEKDEVNKSSSNPDKGNELDSKEEPKPKKPKIDIWKKRTVGEKYDEAVKRYFERKALRESG